MTMKKPVKHKADHRKIPVRASMWSPKELRKLRRMQPCLLVQRSLTWLKDNLMRKGKD
jgi:hypothetical protein